VAVGPALQEEKTQMPDWNKADWDAMRNNLTNTNWRTKLAGLSAEQAWTVFSDKVNRLVKEYVPARRRRNQNRPAWMTREILRAIRKKKRLWKQLRGSQVTEECREVE
jgi:hypothetical protein